MWGHVRGHVSDHVSDYVRGHVVLEYGHVIM